MPDSALTVRTFRVARPTTDLIAITAFYADLVGLARLGGFAEHNGYDGAFIGPTEGGWHIEFTRHESGHPVPTPTDEDLLVLYLDTEQVAAVSARLTSAGHSAFAHPNPYWAGVGALAHRDPDGYVLVLCPTD
ncbi:MAG: VOC family protein [Actinomycetota bacterium]|nr:VOC family protein [Actinomycetota bacterium]